MGNKLVKELMIAKDNLIRENNSLKKRYEECLSLKWKDNFRLGKQIDALSNKIISEQRKTDEIIKSFDKAKSELERVCKRLSSLQDAFLKENEDHLATTEKANKLNEYLKMRGLQTDYERWSKGTLKYIAIKRNEKFIEEYRKIKEMRDRAFAFIKTEGLEEEFKDFNYVTIYPEFNERVATYIEKMKEIYERNPLRNPNYGK